MRVYVTYVSEDSEDYYLWMVSTKKSESIKTYVESDVKSFLSSGPSDVSNLILVSTNVSKQVYEQLVDTDTEESVLRTLLRTIEDDPSTEQIKYCDGDINYDLGLFYGTNYKGMSVSDVEDDMMDIFIELGSLSGQDPEQYDSIVDRFTKQHFGY